ncbi:amidohydrolase family protein [Chloroflexota bacterium]
MKIDIFPHILPMKYRDALYKVAPPNFYLKSSIDSIPTLFDLETRFRIMDNYEDLMQVLTISIPPVEEIADSQKAVDLAKLANDEMADLVFKYPDRFVAAVACLPMNNLDAALKEIDRTIRDLKFRGVQIFTPLNNKPLDSPEYMPLYEKMSQYNLPIWIHPKRGADCADYKTEDRSLYRIFSVFGWPYETTVAMTRLVFSGVMERYPGLKIITHHCGAMVPYFEQRIVGGYDSAEMCRNEGHKQGLTKAPIEYYKMFYNDTALYGSKIGLICGYGFFGADKLLFGTDMPFDNQLGDRYIRQTIDSIEQMDIPDFEKKKIFEDNARNLLRLPV